MSRGCDRCGVVPPPKKLRKSVHPLARTMMPELPPRMCVCPKCDAELTDAARQMLAS